MKYVHTRSDISWNLYLNNISDNKRLTFADRRLVVVVGDGSWINGLVGLESTLDCLNGLARDEMSSSFPVGDGLVDWEPNGDRSLTEGRFAVVVLVGVGVVSRDADEPRDGGISSPRILVSTGLVMGSTLLVPSSSICIGSGVDNRSSRVRLFTDDRLGPDSVSDNFG